MCRMQSVPMKIPRVRFRITAYHIVEASSGPEIGCQGGVGLPDEFASPASRSCPNVATRPD